MAAPSSALTPPATTLERVRKLVDTVDTDVTDDERSSSQEEYNLADWLYVLEQHADSHSSSDQYKATLDRILFPHH